MRGIAGIIHFDEAPAIPAQIQGMIQHMAVGPTDRITTLCDGSAGFAHLIKYLQPEDRFEAQPLRSANGNLLLVTDALLENRDELAAELGFPADELPALPDSVFVLRAYEKWGSDSPCHLEGRFAFAVWHIRERRLFSAVDHFARRPFYYCRLGATFAFASTLRGLLSLPGVSSRLDEGVFADFILYTQTEARDRTLYADIACLPAAHRLDVHSGGGAVNRYWEPDSARTLRFGTDQDYVEAFHAELERAVAAGLRVAGDIGIQVSGGLDSSAVTAVAGKILAQQGKRLQAIHTVPVAEDPRQAHLLEHDESRYVRMLQQHAPHIDFHFLPQDVSPISLSRWTTMMEQSCTPLRGPVQEDSLRPAAQFGLDRMLTGFGGNFIASIEFIGSSYLTQLAFTLRWRRLFQELQGQRRVYGRSFRQMLRHQVLAAVIPPSRGPSLRVELLRFLNPDFVRRASLRDRIRRSESFALRWRDFDPGAAAKAALMDVMPQHVGVAGSIIAADARNDQYHPFYSRRLNEFCMALPPDQQIQDGWDRRLLRRAMSPLLPEALASRTSRGFSLPGSWRQMLSLRAELPHALAQMKGRSEVGSYLALDQVEALLTTPGYLEQGRIGSFQFTNLFNAGWFLSGRR